MKTIKIWAQLIRADDKGKITLEGPFDVYVDTSKIVVMASAKFLERTIPSINSDAFVFRIGDDNAVVTPDEAERIMETKNEHIQS